MEVLTMPLEIEIINGVTVFTKSKKIALVNGVGYDLEEYIQQHPEVVISTRNITTKDNDARSAA